MSSTLLATFGVLSAVTNTVGLIPYVRDILAKKTKPEKATWWIWLSLSAVAFSAQLSAGATWSLFMTGAQLIAVLLIAVLSIRYGYGRFKKKDKLAFVVAFLGVILWALTNRPIVALLIVIIVDISALWLTLSKTWEAPGTETLSAWIMATISGFLGLLAVGKLDITELIYPLYITIGNGSIVSVIMFRNKIKQ